jgi:hypothetical protein
MTSTKSGAGFIGEFREFMSFLQTLWGLLGNISVFFPLSNALLNVVPGRGKRRYWFRNRQRRVGFRRHG